MTDGRPPTRLGDSNSLSSWLPRVAYGVTGTVEAGGSAVVR